MSSETPRCGAVDDFGMGRCVLDAHDGPSHAYEDVPGPPGPPQRWQATDGARVQAGPVSNKGRESLLVLGIEALVRASIDLGWDAREMGVPKIQAKDEAWQGARANVRQMVANVLAAERPEERASEKCIERIHEARNH